MSGYASHVFLSAPPLNSTGQHFVLQPGRGASDEKMDAEHHMEDDVGESHGADSQQAETDVGGCEEEHQEDYE